MKNKIGILGAGWLGEPLAFYLQSHDQNVFVLSRNSIKAPLFNQHGISVYTEQSCEEMAPYCDTFICCVPPIENYFAYILTYLEKLKPKYVVFCSSTSVYKQTMGIVSEKSEAEENSGILAVENSLKSQNIPLVILRLGGLIGPRRNPALHFSGKDNLPNGKGYVNLIQRQEVIEFIFTLIQTRLTGTYNLVYPSHPTRKEYYEAQCRTLGLPSCSFNEEGEGKIVDGQLISQILARDYRYPIE